MSKSKLNTDDVKTSVGGVPKIIQPGNILCKINSIALKPFDLKPEANGYYVVLNLEGPDLGKDFEGFFIDNDDHSKGRHKGQVGAVKASEWAYMDGETKSGIEVSRDAEILKFIKSLCAALELPGRSGETIEDLVEKFNAEKPFANKFMEYCIGGREYIGKTGYTNHDLFLPKFIKGGAPFGVKNVIKFDPATHIRKKKVDTVTEFASDASIDTPAASPGNDFSL